MRTFLILGAMTAAAVVFGATETAKADHCNSGYGGYSYGGYSVGYGYSSSRYSSYGHSHYTPSYSFSRRYYSAPRYGFSGYRGISISIGRSHGHYGRSYGHSFFGSSRGHRGHRH